MELGFAVAKFFVGVFTDTLLGIAVCLFGYGVYCVKGSGAVEWNQFHLVRFFVRCRKNFVFLLYLFVFDSEMSFF